MGTSGGGKTSLISAITGRSSYGELSGKIKVNDKVISDAERNKFGYVPQDDIMIRCLTVREVITLSALIKSSNILQVNQNVTKILQRLGLTHIQDSIIGDEINRGISGGQRKRVNVAMELVNNPSVLFLDEPTSGLDTPTSIQLIKDLKKISKRSTIAAIIHQPNLEIMELFDRVIIMKKGKIVYDGGASVSELEQIFNFDIQIGHNPIDYIMETLTEKDETEEPFEDEMDEEENFGNIQGYYKKKSQNNCSYISDIYLMIIQCFTIFLRSLIQQSREIGNILLDFAVLCFTAYLSSSIFPTELYIGPPSLEQSIQCGVLRYKCELPLKDSILPFCASLNLSIAMLGAITGLKVFGNEKVVFKRDSESGLNTLSYFIAKDFSFLPMSTIFPLGFTIVFWYMSNLRSDCKF